MSDIVNLEKSLQSLEKDIKEYNNIINKLSLKIDEIIKSLGNNSMDLDSVTFDNILNSYQNTLDLNISRDINGLLDYSVDMEDLKEYDTVSLSNGETYTIYFCNKNDALYIVSNINNNDLKKEMFVNSKDKIKNDQMLIITFDGNPYKGNVYNTSESTTKFGMMAKNSEGKVLAFNNVSENTSAIPRSELVVSYNGLALPYGGVICNETGADYNFQVLYQNENTSLTSKQAGLRRCALFVQMHDDTAKSGIGQDLSSEFIIDDEVLEKVCARISKPEKERFLDAYNDNYYEQRYHTIFNESIDEYQKFLDGTVLKQKYDKQVGYLGTHSSIFPITLKTYYANEGYWNSYNFTLTGLSMKGKSGEKQMWATTASYSVDDWNDIQITGDFIKYGEGKTAD